MGDSFKDRLDAIRSEIPISAKTGDFMALAWGAVYLILGFFLETEIGIFTVIVGVVGMATGSATFVWKSPKVKLIQAVNSFLISILLFLFAIRNIDHNPWLVFTGAIIMVWVSLDKVKEYRNLCQLQQEHSVNERV